MRNHLLAAGLAAAALIPSAAFAQQTCEQRSANRVAGTVVGAGIGALLGSAIAGRGDRTEGAVIGGVGGAVVGNQLAKSNGDCTRAYGYYDNDSRWHASSVSASAAAGYYDRDGAWVNGAPDGNYDTNRRWVPTAADGYYDEGGRWTAADRDFGGRSRVADWSDAPSDFRSRSAWLQARVERGLQTGALRRDNGAHALRDIKALRREETSLRHHRGVLGRADAARMQAKLDNVSMSLRWSRRDAAR